MTRIVHLLTWLAVIAVPAAGWFVEDWSGGTTLVVYWFETAAVCLFIAARIVVHQWWNPRRGHFRYQARRTDGRNSHPSSGRDWSARDSFGGDSFVKGFVITSLAFCAGHGVFLGAVLMVLNRTGERALVDVDWHSVGFGCASVLLLLTVDFAVDLLSLRQRSFLEIEQLADRGTSRIIVVHVTLLVGFLGIAVTGAPTALFGAFVVLKTLFALSSVLPQWEPVAAPKGLSRVMNRLGDARQGSRFEEHWARDRADEGRRREQNEQPWVDARH